MKLQHYLSVVALALLGSSACSSTQVPTAERLSFSNDLQVVDGQISAESPQVTYDVMASGIAPKGQVNTWAETLANELVLQNDGLRSDQPLVVATPVMTADYSQTNPLAAQLQQGLMTAFHAHEFNVVDLNVANAIRVTDKGEFLLSRNWEMLPSDLPVAHVLVSTMSLTNEGVVFNGRIVDITNNRVVSSVQSFVDGASLSGYLQAPSTIENRNGLLYRHANAADGRYSVIGDNQ
ncbi:hypothetical protein EXU30_02985 [Shewanella maritima]|uniref:FlgO domain-containing protein n=1 Tax=Shewanella maritima TaxID=2520507 RepID=A0A411PDZ5_9GAMM|nr:FlgO family outer membrane protein [Shewanella maritima]QBF81775.1 hypothetical protein EXU30_02985 [Shewanella maritima]